MGQRHQVFVRVLNPINNKNFSASDKSKLAKLFGRGKYTIMAFHHGWLYGRSATVNILNVLKITNPETMNQYHNPFSLNYFVNGIDMIDDYLEKINNFVSIQTNPLHPRGIGFEGFWLLNNDEPEMRHYFANGDNNDGITIIDTISRKYCMMNIYDQDLSFESNRVDSLPKMLPVSARAYMNAYYPEKISELSDYSKEGKTKLEQKSLVKENMRGNLIIDSLLDKECNGILTVKEIKKMFPKMDLVISE